MTTTPDAQSPTPAPINGLSIIRHEYGRMRRPKPQGEGYTLEDDLQNNQNGQLALAATCYAMPPHIRKIALEDPPVFWPWYPSGWKPTPDNRIHELARAGALIAAEIDRLMTEAD